MAGGARTAARRLAPAFVAALLGAGCGGERMQIVALEWERTVEVERLERQTTGAWRDELPQGTRPTACEKRFHHENRSRVGTRRVVVKTTAKDAGGRETTRDTVESRPEWKSERVEAEWCTWEVQTWQRARTERASGTQGPVEWPVVRLLETEREGARAERYRVVLRDGAGREHRWEPGAEAFTRLEPGARVRVRLHKGAVSAVER